MGFTVADTDANVCAAVQNGAHLQMDKVFLCPCWIDRMLEHF